MLTTTDRVRVFVSYSHADRRWLERLQVHLAPLSQAYEVDIWSDVRIRPGSQWREEIRAAVDRANVAILIVSADFLASDFVRTNELPPLLKAAEEEGALILPIIASPSLFLRTPALARFQAVNDPSLPLVSGTDGDQEAAFVRVAEAILERATSDRGGDEEPETERREAFLEPRTWGRLIKIGDWIYDGDSHRIIGSGMYAYLLSRGEYGETPFVIHASLAFSNFTGPTEDGPGMNAGIILGWKHDKQSPRYYNILLTGSQVIVERVGFKGDDAYQDYEHITAPVALALEGGEPIDFTVRVSEKRVDVFANNLRLHRLERRPGLLGRVGLRPWRSKVDCTKFTVFEHDVAADVAAEKRLEPTTPL